MLAVKVYGRKALPALGYILAALVAAACAMMASAAPALAQGVDAGAFNPENAATTLIGVIGFFILLIGIAFAAARIGRGSIVSALTILIVCGLLFALTLRPEALGDIGAWVLDIFGIQVS